MLAVIIIAMVFLTTAVFLTGLRFASHADLMMYRFLTEAGGDQDAAMELAKENTDYRGARRKARVLFLVFCALAAVTVWLICYQPHLARI